MYLDVLSRFHGVFQHYDLIQGYATDGVYPMLAGKKYIAFEHGTIRKLPFENTSQGRLCAATYLVADEVIITNADNIVAAEKLGLKRYSFVPHPVNDSVLASGFEVNETLRSTLLSELDADFLIFHPARQHWDDQRHPNWEKGNDFLIYALARMFNEKQARVAAIFVEWGESVGKSKELIANLGIEHRVKWIEPQAHREMLEYILACDVLADQFFLGSFGSTMPRALMCGRPALIYLNEELHSWCFPEMPPVINVRTSDEIYFGLCRLYEDKSFADTLSSAGIVWYKKWHSSEFVVNSLLSVYRRILER
jgi:glycosyltransferase involved in cell wall biosynthesis